MLRSWVLRCQLLVQALVRSKQIVKELEDVKISVRCRHDSSCAYNLYTALLIPAIGHLTWVCVACQPSSHAYMQ